MNKEPTSLHSSLDATINYVNHDQTEAITIADKFVALHAGQIIKMDRLWIFFIIQSINLLQAFSAHRKSINWQVLSLSSTTKTQPSRPTIRCNLTSLHNGRDREDQTLVLKVPGDASIPADTTNHAGINLNACFIFDHVGTHMHRIEL